jgi:hypothetical protein
MFSPGPTMQQFSVSFLFVSHSPNKFAHAPLCPNRRMCATRFSRTHRQSARLSSPLHSLSCAAIPLAPLQPHYNTRTRARHLQNQQQSIQTYIHTNKHTRANKQTNNSIKQSINSSKESNSLSFSYPCVTEKRSATSPRIP